MHYLTFHTLGVFIRQMWWNIKINLLEKKKQSVNKKILFVTYFIKLVFRFMSLKSWTNRIVKWKMFFIYKNEYYDKQGK